MSKQTWTVSDITDCEYIGILEFQDNKGEFHDFQVVKAGNRLVFGGACNVGLLESGYMLMDCECETLDEALAELLADLETYYNDRPAYVSRIVCNDRM